jgi:hypothetical protein
MAHVRQELPPGTVGGLGRVAGGAQLQLQPLAVGHVRVRTGHAQRSAAEVLSVVHPYGAISLDQVLLAEGTRFTRNTTLLIVTPSIDPNWVSATRHLFGRGIKVTAVLVNPGSFGVPYDSQQVSTELSVNHVPNFVVNKGDDISIVLGNARR